MLWVEKFFLKINDDKTSFIFFKLPYIVASPNEISCQIKTKILEIEIVNNDYRDAHSQ